MTTDIEIVAEELRTVQSELQSKLSFAVKNQILEASTVDIAVKVEAIAYAIAMIETFDLNAHLLNFINRD